MKQFYEQLKKVIDEKEIWKNLSDTIICRQVTDMGNTSTVGVKFFYNEINYNMFNNNLQFIVTEIIFCLFKDFL